MSEDPSDRDIALKAWRESLRIYAHHFELYLKAVALYFAIIGVAAGFVYKPSLPDASKQIISFLITIFSFVALLGSYFSHRWAKDFGAYIAPFEHRLRLQAFPISGALRTTALFMWTAMALTIISALNGLLLGS